MNASANQSQIYTQSPLSLAQIKDFFSQFNAESLQQIERYYHDNTTFVDPIHRIEGIAALKNYFMSLCSDEMSCRFEFISDHLIQPQESSALRTAFLRWHMHYSHPNLAGGKPCTLEGVSYIIFDSKIIYHQDYYDMGAMVYQQIPVLGWLVKKINTRLAGKKI